MVSEVWIYSILSVVVVSLIAFIGLISLSVNEKILRKILLYLISFAAGALFGGAFLHLIPEAVESGFENIWIYVLLGIVLFFILEKIIQWHHCHKSVTEGQNCIHSFAYMNLIGDGLHNFIDGLVIAASYLVSIPVGFATTVAVVLHEIPQEIGDFGVLVHGGFSRMKALFVNFLSALLAILGAIVALWLGGFIENIELILVPIAAGGFIYIAGSDLIPELHKHEGFWKALLQLIAFLLGILIMFGLLFLEFSH